MRGKKSSINFEKIKECIKKEQAFTQPVVEILCDEFTISDNKTLINLAEDVAQCLDPAQELFKGEKDDLTELAKLSAKLLWQFSNEPITKDYPITAYYLDEQYYSAFGVDSYKIEPNNQPLKISYSIEKKNNPDSYKIDVNYNSLAQDVAKYHKISIEQAIDKVDGFVECLQSIVRKSLEAKKMGASSKDRTFNAMYQIGNYWQNILGRTFSYAFSTDGEHTPKSEAAMFACSIFYAVGYNNFPKVYKANIQPSMRQVSKLLNKAKI